MCVIERHKERGRHKEREEHTQREREREGWSYRFMYVVVLRDRDIERHTESKRGT